MSFKDLTALLRAQVAVQPDNIIYRWLERGEVVSSEISYAELDRKARACAAAISEFAQPGDRVLLLFPPGLEFIPAFFGCLYAGVIAVPGYPPRNARGLPRILGIVDSARPVGVLTLAASFDQIRALWETHEPLARLHCRSVESIPEGAEAGWRIVAPQPDDVAFLQYTSGSTGSPKGVMVTHGNLVHNSGMICRSMGIDANTLMVSWLPPYHDMGLIGPILQTAVAGGSAYLMAPSAFLQRPLRWLQAISRFGATLSGGPNFAYDLCVRKVRDKDVTDLDLSTWRVAFSGAEPIRSETLRSFAQTFSPHGFRTASFFPCYGLAEGTLYVSSGALDQGVVQLAADADALADGQLVAGGSGKQVTLVSSGRVFEDQETVLVVQPESGVPVADGQIGEIWSRSPSVARGYWENEAATQEVFGATPVGYEGTFLRTGDLGFFREGELFIAGRLKDLIIIAGKNHYPQDLEKGMECSHPALRPGAAAAFAVEADEQERLVLIQELEYRAKPDPAEVFAAIRQAIAEQHEVEVHAIVLVKPGSIPLTSSGKIMRRACRSRFLAGELEVVAEWRSAAAVLVEPSAPTAEVTPPATDNVPSPSQSASEIAQWLATELAGRLKVDPATIDHQQTFTYYGLGSVAAVEMVGDLEEWLGQSLSPTLVWDYPTIRQLAEHLAPAPQGAPQSAPEVAELPADDEPIAIVGLAGRFPGAASVDEFWQNLVAGRDAVDQVPTSRWDSDALYSPKVGEKGRLYCTSGGFLAGIEQFDPLFFHLNPAEAQKMDPQQRVFMEVAWEALENSGHGGSEMAGSRTGVFVAATHAGYRELDAVRAQSRDFSYLVGNSLAMVPNRFSFFMDFRGPSVFVDTLCSSSLVAVHLACQSLRSGECSSAVVGAVSLVLDPAHYLGLSSSSALSQRGRCQTFDNSADGFVSGEGVVALVLKPLKAALADGDTITAVIKGSAVNHNGRSNGLSAPNPKAQAELVREALQRARVHPEQISYVEAHGTGTELGDPVELQGLTEAFRSFTDRRAFCAIGSVKSNIGHLEPAAGLAGLTKVLLSMRHGLLPANLHLRHPNRYIRFEETPFYLQDRNRPWQPESGLKTAGVSAFGMGGTNAHVVLQELPASPPAAPLATRPAELITLAARSPEALRQRVADLARFLATPAGQAATLRDLALTLNRGRSHFRHRLALVVRFKDQLSDKLELCQMATAGADLRRSLIFSTVAASEAVAAELLPRLAALTPALRRGFAALGAGSVWEALVGAGLAAGAAGATIDWSQLAEADCVELLALLAECYLAGAEIDWRALDADLGGRRIALPTYPFERQRCWPETPTTLAPAPRREHPWIDTERASLDGALFETRLHPNEWFLAQHRIQGAPLLPGVASVELARHALVRALPGRALRRLRQLTFLRPLPVGEGGVTMRVELTRGDGDLHYRLLSATAGGWQHHASAVIPAEAPLATPAAVALDTWQAQSGLEQAEIYALFQQHGLHYGAGFQAIRRIEFSAGQARAELTDQPNDAAGLEIHPGILDGALQTVGLLAGERQAGAYLPFAIEELRLHGPLRGRLLCLGSAAGVNASGVLHASAQIVAAESGQVVLELAGIALKRLAAPGHLEAAGPARPDLSGWLQQPTWNPLSLPAAEGSLHGRVVLLAGGAEGSWRESLVTGLRAAGAQLITPPSGDSEAAWGALLQGTPPDLLLFLDPHHSAAANSVDQLQQRIEQSATALFLLLQRLTRSSATRPKALHVVTWGAQSIPAQRAAQLPEAAALWGLARVIGIENPSLAVQCIDLDPALAEGEAQPLLLAELARGPAAERAELAFAGQTPWVSGITAITAASTWPAAAPLTEGGVYLITGGMGGIGQRLAEHLARNYRARLILVGRSVRLDAGQVEALRQLGAADLLLEQADVTDQEAMATVVARARARFGRIDGYFHAAGIHRDGLLKEKPLASWNGVLGPKIQGALVLDRLSREERPALFVLFSSVASLVGNVGQGDYAAANRYLDSFAHWRQAQSGLPTLTIDWGMWDRVGMAEGLADSATARGIALLDTPRAMAALEAALGSGLTQLAVVRTDPPAARPAAAARPSRGGSSEREVEEFLVALIARELHIDPRRIDLEQPFFEMGVDSVTALNLIQKIEEPTGATLPRTLFFDYANMRALIRGLIDQHQLTLSASAAAAPAAPAVDTPAPTVPPPPTLPPVAAAQWPVAEEMAPTRGDERAIAVIGLAGRFPGAADVASFWEQLRAGYDAISEIPQERWDASRLYSAEQDTTGRSYSKWGGFLEGLYQFDPLFFRLSPREAEAMDPQQRLMLEVAWEALEDAGYAGGQLTGSETGVFIGATYSHYSRDHVPHLTSDAYATLGNAIAILANRLSYFLDLRGPSLTVDTLCSSSLVALHLAVESLRQGHCQQALVGGVHAGMNFSYYQSLCRLGALSPTGRCHTFDQGADGYVPGEGAGALLLKPLAQAQRDGDLIHAVIRGTAVNHGGRASGLTVPNSAAQTRLIRQALADAKVAADSLSYVECHGTGTSLGDPIEVQGLHQAFREATGRRQFCALGSLKSNIGHLEPAAGIASLIKVISALKAREIPPSLHVQRVNANLALEETAFFVNTRLRPWAQPPHLNGAPRRAGVSAFGMGGANGHVIIEEAPPRPSTNAPERSHHVLLLSARSEAALRRLAQRYLDHFAQTPSLRLADVGHTANRGRALFAHRLAVAGQGLPAASQGLRAFLAGESAPGLRSHHSEEPLRPKLCFLFTGQGAQYPGMGRALYQAHPEFRSVIDRCERHLAGHLERPLTAVLFAEPGSADSELIHRTRYTQPALFALEYALAQLWIAWGVRPDALIGHSVGEYVAACVAGVMSLEAGLTLIATRARLMDSLSEPGAMAAVLAPEAEVAAALGEFADRVAIAALNSEGNTVISGAAEAIAELGRRFSAAGVQVHPLTVSHAFHSPLMDPILAEFEQVAGQVQFAAPQLPLISNLSGAPLAAEAVTADYWRRHLRGTVRFAPGLNHLLQAGYSHFLEIGPHPVLSGLGRQLPAGAEAHWIGSLHRAQPDPWQGITEGLAELALLGVPVDWAAFDRGWAVRKVALPTYPFERQRYVLPPVVDPVADNPIPWLEPPPSAPAAAPRAPLRISLDSFYRNITDEQTAE